MHLVVTDVQMQQHTFRRLLVDFPPESKGFDAFIAQIREGHTIEAASDGSRLDDGRAAAGWLFWTMEDAIDDKGQQTRRPTIMLGGTMGVDGRSDENTTFRAEALGCLIIPLIVCLAKEFINHRQRIGVRHTCDNQGLVDQLRRFYKHERYHTF